ncbi:glycoside hydrolase superfamily [Pelagophyceae sp. CCMP2097]|nr:glycoside hydrolase superfamily [Pelagophyceae sp. CCMP2097]|mmetsp:Transcript_9890/g.34174  ORF Transcript_9890/g.34174 Transcript_9890/m.34174 type:complete len:770 (+) Transcript_9890:69-2378(+)
MRAGVLCALLLAPVAAYDVNAFEGFVPHHNQTCSADTHQQPWLKTYRGVNLGGWLVLEPWITPSLFYQFLSVKDNSKVGMDSFTFCTALGPLEANRQMRRHWETWVTEAHIAELAHVGVNSVRLPIGDWMYAPYEPYIGCMDGALGYVDKVLDWCEKYGLEVLFDVHSVKGSANGLDNGGQTLDLKWTATLADVASDAPTFEHWPRRSASWMGEFDRHSGTIEHIDHENINGTLAVLEMIAHKYKKHPAVMGLEPVNEPWQFTPLKELKDFYFEGYKRVKAIAPRWRYVMHDSFRFNVESWGGFMAGCPDIALDTHIYQAWFDPASRASFNTNACAQKDLIYTMEQAFGPVIVGEWSLATDNCAMWLNGFNDNLPGYPKLPCKFVPCPDPYMGESQPNAPPGRDKALQGPYGTGVSGPLYGLCPIDRDWLKISGIMKQGRSRDFHDLDAQASKPEFDDTDVVMAGLAARKFQAFGIVAHGFFFWNFRTELEDQWSYLRAVERGWFPRNASLIAEFAGDACGAEDVHCSVDPEASRDKVLAAMDYCAGYEPHAMAAYANMYGKQLSSEADQLFDDYWTRHRLETSDACNFDGAARLTVSPYVCVARRVNEQSTRDGLAYCVGYDKELIAEFAGLHGPALWERADGVYSTYWSVSRFSGATCDFGGSAMLVKDEVLANTIAQKKKDDLADDDGALKTPPPTPTPISPAMEGFEVTRVVVAAFAAVVLLFGAAAAIKLRAARLCCGKGKEGSLRQLSEQGRALDESELRPLA